MHLPTCHGYESIVRFVDEPVRDGEQVRTALFRDIRAPR